MLRLRMSWSLQVQRRRDSELTEVSTDLTSNISVEVFLVLTPTEISFLIVCCDYLKYVLIFQITYVLYLQKDLYF